MDVASVIASESHVSDFGSIGHGRKKLPISTLLGGVHRNFAYKTSDLDLLNQFLQTFDLPIRPNLGHDKF